MADEKNDSPNTPARAAAEEKSTVTAPMFWMKSPDSDNVYPVNTAAERTNMLAVGYTIADAPKGMPKATGVSG